jgi:predicted dienelactone hydrolase
MAINHQYQTFFDAERSREIPAKIYLPKEEQLGVVIFSHGLGGSCESYKYFGEFMAAHGFMCIHPTHIGIDAELLKQKRPFQVLKDAADVKENQANPARDIKFILDELKINQACVAGHSFGSYSTLLLAGQDVSKKGYDVEFKDSRVACAIAISPHAALDHADKAYDEICIPILHITGKYDNSPFGFFEPIQRRIPFDNIKAPDQYLVIFEWADHMVFAAQRKGNKFSARDINVMKQTCAVSLEFIKKYLAKAISALDTPEFAANMNTHAIFERR